MRVTVIKCDKCGEVIEGDPYKIRVLRDDLSMPDDINLIRTENDGYDLCENCIAELIDLVGAFIKPEQVSDTAPENIPVNEEDVVIEPEEEQPKETKGGRKNNCDAGKVRALYEAGWAVREIAGEFGVSEQTVYNWLKQLKLK